MDISKIDFPLQIQKEILDYFLIHAVSTQNPKNITLLLRAENQTFSEVDKMTIKAYIRYVILCKENWKKAEILELLKVRFFLKDQALSIITEDQS